MHKRNVCTKPRRVHGLVWALLFSVVVQASGSQKAILIAGGIQTEDAVWPATDYLAGRAYTTLLSRGFAKTDIRYLSRGPARDVDGDGNATNDMTHPNATRSDAEDTFVNWVGNVDSLTVIVLSHGLAFSENAGFQLNATETVAATELDAWLDALQTTHTKMHATVILDYSFAEQSLAELSLSGTTKRRIVIASTGVEDRAHFVSGGPISFSQHFLDGVRAGQNLWRCFTESQGAMARFQGAGLDDDQDGVASRFDGAWARLVFIGSDVLASDPRPNIGRASADQQLNGDTSASFFAEDITTPTRVDRVWCAVVPPGYAPGFSTGTPVTEVTTRDLPLNPRVGGIQYAATIDGFTVDGDYDIQMYVLNGSGAVSLPALTLAEQQGRVEKVVLVAAGDPGDSKFSEVRNMSKQVFLSLRDHLIPHTHIQYLSNDVFTDFDGDTINDIDAPLDLLSLQNAIQTWSQGADQLTVYLIGQFQSAGIYRLSGTQSVLALDVGAWLNQYQAPDRPAIVVMDFPSSGDFLSALTPYTLAPRTVIGSSRSNRTPVLADDLSFTDFFANRLQAGDSVGEAALWARAASLKASGSLFQNVLIEDSGNGTHNEKGVDGQASLDVYIGTPFFPGSTIPSIALVMPEAFLSPTTTSLELFVDGVSDPDGIASVRAHVTPPTNVADAVSSVFPLSQVGTSSQWKSLVPGFDVRGPYHVTFIAEDTLGNIRHSTPTLVLKTDSDRLVFTDPLVADPREPDSSVGTARMSDFPILGYQTLNASNDADWIKFYALPNEKYDIGFLAVGGVLDLTIELYREVAGSYPDTESTVIALVDTVDEVGADGDEVVGLDFAAPGFYYLKIVPSADFDFSAGGYVTYSTILNGLEGLNVYVVNQVSGALMANASVTVRNQFLQPLDTETTDGNGRASFPFDPAVYLVDVTPPSSGYAKSFDPCCDSEHSENPHSKVYGNPRWIVPADFQAIQFVEGGPIFTSSTRLFLFLPIARFTGVVYDTVYGPLRPVPNAQVTLTQQGPGYLYQGWPWASYGVPWLTSAAGQFPATTEAYADRSYRVRVEKAHYQPWESQPTGLLNLGEIFDVGNVVLAPQDVNMNNIPDPWEIDFFGVLVDGAGDSDIDHTTHYDEYVAGTHPLNTASVFQIPNISMTEAGVQLTWTVEAFRNYRVFSTPDPSSGKWTLAAGPFPSAGVLPQMSWTDLDSQSDPRKTYLLEVRIFPN